MRKQINKKATFGKKALCVLASAALVASLGFGAAFAAGESDAEGTGETGEAAPAATSETALTQSIQQRGVSQLSEAQPGSEVWIKGGSQVYKSKQGEGRELSLPHKIKVVSVAEESGATWYEFSFVDLAGAWFLSDYKFVKAENVSATEPSGSQAGGIAAGTADGDVSLSVSGAPSGAQVQVTSVAPRNAHSDVFEYVTGGRSLAFAVDINIKNGGTAWQPENGKTAVVSLDAAKLGLTNGDEIGILHEHDGTLSELGEYTVTDGKLTFETDGFSSFYGYTVDFEYAGTWHSITGGTGIFLSELFSELGISADASQATNVVFSNPDLVEVSKRLNYDPENPVDEWYLRSLAAFDTEELLTVTFADSSVMKINVFDAISSYSTWTGVTAEYGDGYGADKADVGSIGEQITINGTCTINIKGNLNIRNQFYIGDGAILKIRSAGDNVTITRDPDMCDDLFVVEGTGKLDIRPHDDDQSGQENENVSDRITIDGGKSFTVKDDATSASKTAKTITGDLYNSTAILLQGNGTVWMNEVTFQNFFTSNDRELGAQKASVIHTRPLGVVNATGNCTNLAMRNCEVTHCATSGCNSIILLADCKASMTDCKITDCFSGMNQYAGVLKGNGSFYVDLTMDGCTMSDNYSSGWGGALLWAANMKLDDKESQATIKNCTFTNNTAKWLGGAISNEAKMTLSDTTISGNEAMSGGGLAVFPYTLTKTEPGTDMKAIGLTMGKGNKICKNESLATESSWTEDIRDKDNVTYNSGGGGIWVYLNQENWTAFMEIGEGNTISNNEAAYKGGGVDINTVSSSSTNLKITGATITENKARFGGGVALKESYVSISSGKIDSNTATENGGGIYMKSADPKDVCKVSGEGSVSNNTAANGGGIYLEQGELDVAGGLITGNKAKQSVEVAFAGSTAKTATSGVGGGIYVSNGSFTLSADQNANKIGLHSNTADVAAADAYAAGGSTTLTLPDVKAMELSGWTGEGKPMGWYADYMVKDVYYPSELLAQDNPGRYDYDDPNKLEVKHDPTLKNNKAAYYCLTIGTPQQGVGSLTITKKLVDSKGNAYTTSEDQTFIFEVTPGTTGAAGAADSAGDAVAASPLKVAVVVKANTSSATATVKQLPYGTYTVTEKSDWSWRYELDSLKVAPQGGTLTDERTFVVSSQNPDWTVTAVNKRSNDKWLSGDCYCENWWRGTGGEIVRDPQPQTPSDDNASMK